MSLCHASRLLTLRVPDLEFQLKLHIGPARSPVLVTLSCRPALTVRVPKVEIKLVNCHLIAHVHCVM